MPAFFFVKMGRNEFELQCAEHVGTGTERAEESYCNQSSLSAFSLLKLLTGPMIGDENF